MFLHKCKSLECALGRESEHSIKSRVRIRGAIDVGGVTEDTSTTLGIRPTEDL